MLDIDTGLEVIDEEAMKEKVQAIVESVPVARRNAITPEYIEKLMKVSDDETIRENIIDNYITYASILRDGKYHVDKYMQGITFVSFLCWKHTRREAFEKTFPDLYREWIARNLTTKDINTRISSYANSKLVTSLLEQVQTPAWLLHAPVYHEAVAVQADLMKNGKSEMVRMQAANSVLTHMKKPDNLVAVELQGVESSGKSEIEMLRELLIENAEAQKELIRGGQTTAANIAKNKFHPDEVVVDADFEDVEGGTNGG